MKKKKSYNIAVVGATGMVGRKILDILDEREFPAGRVALIASPASAGKKIQWRGRERVVAAVGAESFKGCDVAFFCAGAAVSRDLVPIAVRAGAVAIDKSSVFRMRRGVPLVVPEVNPGDLDDIPLGIVASPNCSTIPLVMLLEPLRAACRVTRVIVATYQAVSGAGMKGVEEMMRQARARVLSEALPAGSAAAGVFPRQIAFNLFPQIDAFAEKDYTKEEAKLIDETRKILHDGELPVTCTAVRVPVTNAHGEAVTIDFEAPVSAREVRAILASAPGVRVVDDPGKGVYPTPQDATGIDDVLVGRIREDTSRKGSVNLWLVCDNVRKGAATNAVQIAEKICQ